MNRGPFILAQIPRGGPGGSAPRPCRQATHSSKSVPDAVFEIGIW